MSVYDGYIRVSQRRGRSGDSFISPAVQKEQIRGWAKLHDVQLGEVFQEIDVSGATMQRPELEKALARIADGSSKGLIVAKLDRFGRTADAARVIEEIERHGAVLVSVAENFDTSTPAGDFARTMMLALAKMQLAGIRDGWATSRERAIERGVWIGPVPLGYDRLPDRTLAKNDDAPKIEEAFLIAANTGLGPALDYLSATFPDGPVRNVKDKGPTMGARCWSIAIAQKLLARRIYLGEVHHGEFIQSVPELVIIDPATFDLAQHARPIIRRTKLLPEFPLSGIATCASCSRPLVAHLNRQTGARQMRCINATCTARVHVNADSLEAYLLDKVRANPPAADPMEHIRRALVVNAAQDALVAHRAAEPSADAETWLRTAWTAQQTVLEAALVAAMDVRAAQRAELPDLADPSTADRRLIFERAFATEAPAVRRGRGPITSARIEYRPR